MNKRFRVLTPNEEAEQTASYFWRVNPQQVIFGELLLCELDV